MQHDTNEPTEFFIKALYHWFANEEDLADYNMEVALTSLRVNALYQQEVLNRLN